MKIGKSRLFALAAAHGAALFSVPSVLQAQAQAQAPTGQLEEIIVTARQREERIEDVPVSITAFTATEIRSAGIERPTDFIALTPGAGTQLHRMPRGDRVALILGPEGPGLSPEIIARCQPVGIPMSGGFDSLNVSVASGIALHHFTRQA